MNSQLENAVKKEIERIDSSIYSIETEIDFCTQAMTKCGVDLLKVEKLILQSQLRTNNKQLFPIMLEKYNEKYIELLNVYAEAVKMGLVAEESYLDFCRCSLLKQENMKACCYYGVHCRKNT